jgi:hypothetical protein
MADVESIYAAYEGFCVCNDWEPCPCGTDNPPHCMYCAKSLTQKQLAAFNFEEWEHIPPRPKSLPIRISCGFCGVTIDNPTQEQIDEHFNEEHIRGKQPTIHTTKTED